MSKKLFFLSFSIGMLYLLSGCGILPPTQDLDLAKKNIEKLERVEAEKYAPDKYHETKKLYTTGEKNMVKDKDSKNKEAKKFLEQASSKATNAYKEAAPKYANHYIEESKGSMTKAKEIKANVAVKNDFNKANNLMKEANGLYEKGDYEKAADKAKESKFVSEQAYKKAVEKKARSEDAIKEAENKISELESE